MLVIVLGARGVRGLATQSNSVLRVSLAVLTVCMVSHSLHVSVWCECSQTGSSPQWSGVEVLEYINGISMVEIQKLLYTFLYQWKGYNYCYPLFFDGHDYMRIIDSQCIEIDALS